MLVKLLRSDIPVQSYVLLKSSWKVRNWEFDFQVRDCKVFLSSIRNHQTYHIYEFNKMFTVYFRLWGSQFCKNLEIRGKLYHPTTYFWLYLSFIHDPEAFHFDGHNKKNDDHGHRNISISMCSLEPVWFDDVTYIKMMIISQPWNWGGGEGKKISFWYYIM